MSLVCVAFINQLNHSRVCLDVDLSRPDLVSPNKQTETRVFTLSASNNLWTNVRTIPAKCECALKPKVYFTFRCTLAYAYSVSDTNVLIRIVRYTGAKGTFDIIFI